MAANQHGALHNEEKGVPLMSILCCRPTNKGGCWQPRSGTLWSDTWPALHVEQLP